MLVKERMKRDPVTVKKDDRFRWQVSRKVPGHFRRAVFLPYASHGH